MPDGATQRATHSLGYFRRVSALTPTEFWINNPTLAEAEKAMSEGAVGATTNPTYVARLLKEEPDYITRVMDAALRRTDDVEEAVGIAYADAVGRLRQLFEPLHERTLGRLGYVAAQGDPRKSDDPGHIVREALRHRSIGPNVIVKVPAWPAGAVALEELSRMGVPTIATLGFSVDQAIYMAEAHRRGLEGAGVHAPCYITFIAGVLDVYLLEQAHEADPAVLDAIRMAGCAATRVAYQLFASGGFEARLMGGGARAPHHFTELVGGDMAITIGWSIAQQLLGADPGVVSRIGSATPARTIEILEARFPEFRAASHQRSLSPDGFHRFGPVAAFQASFVSGFSTVARALADRRAAAIGS